ncbi:40S ribosomal protein S27 [Mycoemilia scoparia]|uniref:1,3-beta-glucanosyltransferase n=1 Tax=Mycoemilia scoparia TaxID=417184 RepID=A0A9W8DTY0_9FUNG|nr:40S ribosomal protein S27 [Mycoemilia scoparia]
MKLLTTAALCFVAMNGLTNALDPLTTKGAKIFNSKTGDQFYFKGVAYQPRTGVDPKKMDPLADTEGCKRDIKVFKDLGLNAIRVYDVIADNNHDECMKALDDAGIYLVLDLPNASAAINRADPSWDTDLFSHYKKKVDTFINYDNIAAFIIGNEVTNDLNNTMASAYVKAATRDIKNYIKSKKKQVPVGYADNDDPTLAKNLVPYFNCGDDPSARVDFYAINTYRWCGDKTTFETSGYSTLTDEFKDFSVPVFLSEYGCNKVRPRTFPEIKSIYGSDMQDVFSGGFMYEYTEEDNEYGIVKVSNGDKEVEKTEDYDNFKDAIKDANPKGTNMKSYNQKNDPAKCPDVSENWQVSSKGLPPTPNEDVCSCMANSLKCSLSSSSSTSGDSKALGDVLGNICGQSPKSCIPVSGNTTTATYGEYSACSSQQRSSFILNANFLNQKGKDGACKIDGVDTSTNDKPSADADDCKKKASEASKSSGSGSSSSGNSDSKSDGGSDKDGASTSSFASMLPLTAMVAIAFSALQF